MRASKSTLKRVSFSRIEMSNEFNQAITVEHPNIMFRFKNDVNSIPCWQNMSNCNAYFKLDFKADFSFPSMFCPVSS